MLDIQQFQLKYKKSLLRHVREKRVCIREAALFLLPHDNFAVKLFVTITSTRSCKKTILNLFYFIYFEFKKKLV